MNATSRIDAADRSEGLQPPQNRRAFGPGAKQATPDASEPAANRRLVLLLTWIYCLSWAADFRGEAGGSIFQMLTFAITAGTGFLMAITGWSVLFRRPLGW